MVSAAARFAGAVEAAVEAEVEVAAAGAAGNPAARHAMSAAAGTMRGRALSMGMAQMLTHARHGSDDVERSVTVSIRKRSRPRAAHGRGCLGNREHDVVGPVVDE